jgi:transcriptional regulator with PAS, ATPase and Fis domain
MSYEPKSDELTRTSLAEPAQWRVPPVALRKAPGSSDPHCVEFLGMTAVVSSVAMRRLLQNAEKIGRTNSPVMITGESGTGKELVARAIHHFSPRIARPFIDVNCAALPDNLVESELFGYEKGAFSGAEAVKPGLFEAAAGGTLFLDEIGELDPRMQAKLLRVLDGQPYFRLGGTRKVTADARIVAATNLDLNEAVQRGAFRRDLFHRLDVFHLHVPALRERAEDVAPLTALFLRDSGLTINDDAMRILEECSWPGNIRELRNVLSKAVLFASGKEIRPGDLPAELTCGDTADPDLEYSLDDLEQQTIIRVLHQTNGHQQKAAELLGISRRTLIRKLKLYRSPRRIAQHGLARPSPIGGGHQ